MANDNTIEYFNSQVGSEEVYTNEFLDQQNELPVLYKKLINKRFNVQKWIDEFSVYAKKHKRIRYAILTSLIIGEKKDNNTTNLNINLETINSVIRKQDSASPKAIVVEDDVFDMYFKFFDHCSLALTQRAIFHQSDEMTMQRTKKIVEQNMAKAIEDKVAEYDKNITNQLIGLVSIFTALSFILFGGINSFESLMNKIAGSNSLKLLFIGDLWFICMFNLLFIFVKLIAVLTNKKKLRLWPYFFIVNIVLIIVMFFVWGKLKLPFYAI